jgi:hypothetical protein
MADTDFTPGSCAVCGTSPTVKSHIIPRAIAHDLRGTSKHLVSGELDRTGVKFLQSGRWDPHILCKEHEASLSAFDDYGVQFVRSFRSDSIPVGKKGFEVENPNPRHLQMFLLSLIWRKDLSNRAKGQHSQLGPYARNIEKALFEDGGMESPALIFQSPTSVAGKRTPIAVEPFKVKLQNTNSWLCGLGWIDAAVKLDRRHWPREWAQFDATKTKPARIVAMDTIDILNNPSLRPLIDQMKAITSNR